MEIKNRNMTLVLAKDRNERSIKEALFARRTIDCANDLLIGDKKYLQELMKASLEISDKQLDNPPYWYMVKLKNTSDITYTIEDSGKNLFIFPADRTVIIRPDKKDNDMQYKVINTYISSDEHLTISLSYFMNQKQR